MEPKCNGMVCFPYVLIVLPLAAIGKGADGLMHVPRPVAGRTLTSAPVSYMIHFVEGRCSRQLQIGIKTTLVKDCP